MGSRGSAGSTAGARVFGREPNFSSFHRFATQREANDYHSTANFDWTRWRELNASARNGVFRYTGSWYGEMNTSLREGRAASDRVQSYIDGATEALGKWQAAEDMMAFRGAGSYWTANLLGGTENQLSNPAFLRSRIGKTVTDKGFMSSGTHEESSWSGIQYKIYVHKGVEGMYVEPVTANKGEYEFLFNRNTSFKVHQIKTDSQGMIKEMVLEALPRKH